MEEGERGKTNKETLLKEDEACAFRPINILYDKRRYHSDTNSDWQKKTRDAIRVGIRTDVSRKLY